MRLVDSCYSWEVRKPVEDSQESKSGESRLLLPPFTNNVRRINSCLRRMYFIAELATDEFSLYSDSVQTMIAKSQSELNSIFAERFSILSLYSQVSPNRK